MSFIFDETPRVKLSVPVAEIYNCLYDKLNNKRRYQYIKQVDLSALNLTSDQKRTVIKILNSNNSTLASILSEDNGKKCVLCGSTDNIHVDHIIPVWKGGGASWVNNFQLLCKSCHKEKTKEDVQGVDRRSKKKSTKTKPVSFRLDEELLEALEAKAKQENRKLTNLVETILKEFLNGNGKRKN